MEFIPTLIQQILTHDRSEWLQLDLYLSHQELNNVIQDSDLQ